MAQHFESCQQSSTGSTLRRAGVPSLFFLHGTTWNRAGTALWACTCAAITAMFAAMLCRYHLEILNNSKYKVLHFPAALDSANYVANTEIEWIVIWWVVKLHIIMIITINSIYWILTVQERLFWTFSSLPKLYEETLLITLLQRKKLLHIKNKKSDQCHLTIRNRTRNWSQVGGAGSCSQPLCCTCKHTPCTQVNPCIFKRESHAHIFLLAPVEMVKFSKSLLQEVT